ncbi:flippase [Candidatus Uhrbacteria bacterium]|nr:flippase [Candidatus Uhrbacteria bacterium]
MASAKSLAHNFSIQLAGKVLSVLIGLLAVAIITRALGTYAFGEFTTATTYLQMFGSVVDFGLTLTLIVMISETGADETRIVGNFLGLRLFSGFILFSLAPLTVLFFPWSTTVKQAVLVGAFGYFLMGGATMLLGVFQRHEAMWRAALAELLNRSVLLALLTFIALTSAGVVAMMGVSVMANFVWLLLMIHFASPFVHVRPLFMWSEWKGIIARSWPIAVSIIFNLLYLKGDILFLAYFRDQTQVGLYGMSYRIIDVLTVLPVMFMGLVLPSLVAAWSAGHTEEFRLRVARTFDVFAMAVVPLIVGAQLVATDLIVLIAGKDFADAGPVLAVLILALVGVYAGALYGHLVVAINRQRIMTWGYIGVAILSILGYFWFIPPYGIWGAVWVTLFSEAAIALITFLVVSRATGSRPNLTVTFKALAAGAVMYATLKILPESHVVIDVLVGATVYGAMLLALKAVSVQELKSLLPTR